MPKIAFPQLADYNVPAKYLFKKITSAKIIDVPKITNKTIEIGNSYSPEFVCTPFKFTLGSLIEGINKGADTLIQFGGGCRYGYYYKLQEQIIKDLGYNIKFYNLMTAGKGNVKEIYKIIKEIEPKFKIYKLYYLLITVRMVKYMDKIDDYIRSNIGFEVNKGSFINLKKQMLKEFSNVKSLFSLHKTYKKYLKQFKNLEIKKENVTKVGVIGELYTLMEPFSNYYLEMELAKYNIEVKRFTNVDYLLFKKKKVFKKSLKYVETKLEADATNNIYWSKWLCENNYNGIIHIKSSFCTPEIGVMNIINKICNNYDVPVIFMSFDANTSEVGIKTRLEAFVDMIEMRKNKCI